MVNDMKADIIAHKGHTILAGSILLVVWARIESQSLSQHLKIGSGKQLTQGFGQHHLQLLPLVAISKTAKSIRMTVDISQVGFNIVDRRAIHQVCPQDINRYMDSIYLADAHRRQS